jgi:hypothetical protein
MEGRGRVQQGLSTTQPGPAETAAKERESNRGLMKQHKLLMHYCSGRAGHQGFTSMNKTDAAFFSSFSVSSCFFVTL